jgi:putative oxygen-independent coproporphyrinogen III oxidase
LTDSTGISLYIHWPYCARICPYCDFNVTRDRGQTGAQQALYEAIKLDLQTQAQLLGPRKLKSLFFGGGTPSLMPAAWVQGLIDAARSAFTPDEAIEITLEANPTDAEAARFAAFFDAGINRLSLGVQSLDDDYLRFLGRNHSSIEALTALETAQKIFARVSVDLIYALPDQGLDAWAAQIKAVAATDVEHISPYQLTIEPQTAFGRQVKHKLWTPVPDQKAVDFYELTQSSLSASGFEAYEISNHAKGFSARSTHNLLIWQGGDYMGIGPGAHGRLTIDGVRTATEAISDLKTYTTQVQTTGKGCDLSPLTPLETEEERLMLGLRLKDGVDLSGFSLIDLSRAKALIEDGFLAMSEPYLSATPKGRMVLDRLLFELLV